MCRSVSSNPMEFVISRQRTWIVNLSQTRCRRRRRILSTFDVKIREIGSVNVSQCTSRFCSLYGDGRSRTIRCHSSLPGQRIRRWILPCDTPLTKKIQSTVDICNTPTMSTSQSMSKRSGPHVVRPSTRVRSPILPNATS